MKINGRTCQSVWYITTSLVKKGRRSLWALALTELSKAAAAGKHVCVSVCVCVCELYTYVHSMGGWDIPAATKGPPATHTHTHTMTHISIPPFARELRMQGASCLWLCFTCRVAYVLSVSSALKFSLPQSRSPRSFIPSVHLCMRCIYRASFGRWADAKHRPRKLVKW